jgi:hypothetical protein
VSFVIAFEQSLTTHYALRLAILNQYRAALDPELAQKDPEAAANSPPYRYLFHCYYYQHQLWRFAQNVIDLVRFSSAFMHHPSNAALLQLAAMDALDKKCGGLKLYLPVGPFLRRMIGSLGFGHSDPLADIQDDENPSDLLSLYLVMMVLTPLLQTSFKVSLGKWSMISGRLLQGTLTCFHPGMYLNAS